MNTIYNKKPVYRTIIEYKDFKIIIILIGIILFATIFVDNFNTLQNFTVILTNVSIIGIISVGVSMLMISGEFDISVGGVVAFGPYIMLSLINIGVNQYLAILAALLLGIFTGLFNGFIVTRFRIPSLIATLGATMVWRGMTLLISQGLNARFPERFVLGEILAGKIGFFPIQFLWFFIITIILWVILENTRFGNWVFSTGGNRVAAESHGINTKKVKITSFIIVGMLASFAGIVQGSQLGSIFPLQGSGMELSAIAATVIGGTSIAGGAGSIIGTFVGVIIISLINNILILAGAPGFYYQLFVGLIIIFVVILYKIKR